jgi:hypothetical protein
MKSAREIRREGHSMSTSRRVFDGADAARTARDRLQQAGELGTTTRVGIVEQVTSFTDRKKAAITSTRSADQALRRVVAVHLARHRRVGVSFEETASGLLIKAGKAEHVLELRNGPGALDGALRQLGEWGVLR